MSSIIYGIMEQTHRISAPPKWIVVNALKIWLFRLGPGISMDDGSWQLPSNNTTTERSDIASTKVAYGYT